MKLQGLLLMIVAGTFAVLLVGCEKAPDIASPTCADLDKITDPVQKEELLKTCPRSGSGFKPSPKKSW
ncbi:MAG: entry exclusion lipoprotein TrbK [Methylococcaceae bacterium]|nr:entry exclusion lipoprotein TrbK [Methylococcaceae bacterium]